MEEKNRDLIFLLAWCGLIFTLSHQPSLPLSGLMLFPNQDKLHHAIAYALMALLCWRFLESLPLKRKVKIAISLLFCSLFGISDEWHQSFVPGREADILDWLADTSGAALAILFLDINRSSASTL